MLVIKGSEALSFGCLYTGTEAKNGSFLRIEFAVLAKGVSKADPVTDGAEEVAVPALLNIGTGAQNAALEEPVPLAYFPTFGLKGKYWLEFALVVNALLAAFVELSSLALQLVSLELALESGDIENGKVNVFGFILPCSIYMCVYIVIVYARENRVK